MTYCSVLGTGEALSCFKNNNVRLKVPPKNQLAVIHPNDKNYFLTWNLSVIFPFLTLRQYPQTICASAKRNDGLGESSVF